MIVKLADIIVLAQENKPPMGDDCNHCGWCCLTEVCEVGQRVTGTSVIPCKLLSERDGGYYCSLADTSTGKKLIGSGVGCCAKTQKEAIQELGFS